MHPKAPDENARPSGDGGSRRREQFLYIVKMNRPADQRQEVIKFHVPLELRQVSRSPGAEHARTAGECKKFLHGLRKWDSVLQILFCQIRQFIDPFPENFDLFLF